MFLLVSLSLMTLTEVLENYFLLPLMQEAWCRSWRPCVQTLLLHTHVPSPYQVVPLEHFCVGRNSCWTVALTHPKPLTDPVAQILGSVVLHLSSRWECTLWAGWASGEQRLLQTPDSVVLLIPYFLKNAPTVGVCVCLFHFVEVFHPNFLWLTW